MLNPYATKVLAAERQKTLHRLAREENLARSATASRNHERLSATLARLLRRLRRVARASQEPTASTALTDGR